MATIGENVIVVDHDDDFVRAGYPIPERDPLLQPSLVRRSGGGDGELLRPVVNRRVVDWDQLESVYAHVFYRQLGWVEGDEGAALVTEPEALSALSLPSHWMRSFFDAHAALEAQQNKQARARPRLTEPAEAVPRSLLASPLRPPPGARGHRRSRSTRSCSAHSRARRSSSESSPSRSTTSASLMRHSTPSNSYCTTTRAG